VLLNEPNVLSSFFKAGAASHLDLFDYQPELIERHGQLSDFGEHVEAFQDGLGPWLKPVWDFKPYGQSGKLLGEPVIVAGLKPFVEQVSNLLHTLRDRGWSRLKTCSTTISSNAQKDFAAVHPEQNQP
jgi:hypothetical protein